MANLGPWPQVGRPALRLESRCQLANVMQEGQCSKSGAIHLIQRAFRRRLGPASEHWLFENPDQHRRYIGAMVRQGMSLT